jgi:hypothetical protein
MGTISGITVAEILIMVIPLQAVFNCQNSFNPMLFSHRLRRYIGRYISIRDPSGNQVTQTDTGQHFITNLM